jgi:hypothetical protein
MNFIEFSRDSSTAMSAEIARQRLCIELAAWDAHLLRQMLCGFKNGVWK